MARFAYLCVLVCAFSAPAAAQDAAPATVAPAAPSFVQMESTAALVTAKRPSALVPLYGSTIALQGLDFYSTRRALQNGTGREANPVMQPVARSGAALFAVKAAGAAGTIWAAERLWKHNRIA